MNFEKKKTVVTGIGMISALGVNVEKNWENLVKGQSGVRKVSLFDASECETQIAAEVDSELLEDVYCSCYGSYSG